MYMFMFDCIFVLSSIIKYRLARDFRVARPSLTGGNVVNVATCSLTRGCTCVGVGHSCGGCLPPGVLFPLFFPSPPSCRSAPPGTTWIRRVSPGDVRKNYWMNGDVTRPAAWKVCEPFPLVSTVFTPFRFSSRVTHRSTITIRFFRACSRVGVVADVAGDLDTIRLRGS